MDSPMQLNALKKHWIFPVLALISSYGVLRFIFQHWESSKQAFIYPVGYFIQSYFGRGFYTGEQWLFDVGGMPFTLSTQCSGTTFFSLITAFVIYKSLHNTRLVPLLLVAYPLALVANVVRVTSLIITHRLLDQLKLTQFNDAAHVLIGTVSFLSILLIFVWLLEHYRQSPRKDSSNAQ